MRTRHHPRHGPSDEPTTGSATLRIRRAVSADAARLGWIRTASWRGAYSQIISPRVLERMARNDGERMRRAVAQQRAGHAVWLVEDAQGTALGYSWTGPQTDRQVATDRPFLGEVYELYLHPQWQRRGAGSMLLAHAIWDLVDARVHPVMLWVLGENDARHFYEGLGGVEFARRRIEIGGRAMTKIAYGWHEQLPLPPHPR